MSPHLAFVGTAGGPGGGTTGDPAGGVGPAGCGWLLDTFGQHPQIPQLMVKCGFDHNLFQRLGTWDGPTEYWWQGLDGTKMLSFDEPATGSWYNSDLSYKQFQEMLDFQKNTGSKDMLWVYGVGNHGGGQVQTAKVVVAK